MRLRIALVALLVLQFLHVPTLAKAMDFSIPYLYGETVIPLNIGNVPTKLHARAQTAGGVIHSIVPLGKPNTWPAFYMVRDTVLYVTGHMPGYVYFQVNELRSDGKLINSEPILLTFYQIQLHAAAQCGGYNEQEHFATVSSLKPLRLVVSTEPALSRIPDLNFSLANPALGTVNIIQPSLLEVSYQQAGESQLIATVPSGGASIKVLSLPLEFLASKNIEVNFYHVRDPQGFFAWKLRQSEMIHYLQQAESILNQAGVTITIGEQHDVYLPTSIGVAVDAALTSVSAEEQLIIDSTDLRTNAISVFVVWDYQIDSYSKAGMNYFVPGAGEIVFITEQTNKPGETLAHELSHALGLEHNVLGTKYLMAAQEYSTIQCTFSRQEIASLHQAG